jgi:hypothetical protein
VKSVTDIGPAAGASGSDSAGVASAADGSALAVVGAGASAVGDVGADVAWPDPHAATITVTTINVKARRLGRRGIGGTLRHVTGRPGAGSHWLSVVDVARKATVDPAGSEA